MAVVVISTVYAVEPVMTVATKMTPDRMVLLIDENPDETLEKTMEVLKESVGKVVELKVVETPVYDIVKNARETVRIIDLLSDKDQIIINVTGGRKPKALGLLFGAYARSDRVKQIVYVTEEEKRIITLPKCSYQLTESQRKVLKQVKNRKIGSFMELSKKIGISRGMLYRNIKELKNQGMIVETSGGFALTDFGKIVLL